MICENSLTMQSDWARVDAMTDEDIDYSDIPELGQLIDDAIAVADEDALWNGFDDGSIYPKTGPSIEIKSGMGGKE